jgi:hypothetical protein
MLSENRMADRGCSHLNGIDSAKEPKIRACAECVKTRRAVGAPSHVPGVRNRAVLRQLAEPTPE